MSDGTDVPQVVSASREIAAGADQIFELIADPAQQPRWDGNNNLARAGSRSTSSSSSVLSSR